MSKAWHIRDGAITALPTGAALAYFFPAGRKSEVMGDVLVTIATPAARDFESILRRVAEIADELAYRKEDARDGRPPDSFLLSNYRIDTYRKLAQAGQLRVALKEGGPVAFAVVYPPDIPAAKDDPGTGYIRTQFGAVPVIKQIATARAHERRGYSRLLYGHFAEQHPALPVFAAIAEQPRNHGSESFHSKMGFTKCATFVHHPDGRPRGIWRRPPAGSLPR